MTKTADVTEAAPGDVITYTVDVAPNVTREDLTYSITDSLPAGTTYVEGSATDGATYADGKITWSADPLEAPTARTRRTPSPPARRTRRASTRSPGEADYTDLPVRLTRKPEPSISGDSKAVHARRAAPSRSASTRRGHRRDASPTTGSWSTVAAQLGDTPAHAPGRCPTRRSPTTSLPVLWQDMPGLLRRGGRLGRLRRLRRRRPVHHRVGQPRGGGTRAGASLDIQVFVQEGSNDLVWVYDDINRPLDEVTVGTENADGTERGGAGQQGRRAGADHQRTPSCA